MKGKKYSIILSCCLCFACYTNVYGQADPATYLKSIQSALRQKWPDNRTINLVFHGHSVPTGYGRTPNVHRLQAYPFQVLKRLDVQYPYSVINVITTSIGGENSVQGAKRFKKDVLPLRPDVLFIDYALNDRSIGLDKARKADEKMIRIALRHHIKVLLVTPSPDLGVDLRKPDNILAQFSDMLIALAKKYRIGLVDSYAAFEQLALDGKDLHKYMAQVNHPNAKGHAVIAQAIMKWF